MADDSTSITACKNDRDVVSLNNGRNNTAMEKLEDYFNRYGHCSVPQHYKATPGLGHFVQDQRVQFRLFKQGKPSSMNVERIRMLEELRFCWNQHDKRWMERYKELVRYSWKFGHCWVPFRHSTLGRWVHTQRGQFILYQQGNPSRIN